MIATMLRWLQYEQIWCAEMVKSLFRGRGLVGPDALYVGVMFIQIAHMEILRFLRKVLWKVELL